MMPVFVGRPGGKVDNPILWSSEEPQPRARIPYCSTGLTERRTMKTAVPNGDGSLTPRWIMPVGFLPLSFAGSFFGLKELMLADSGKLLVELGIVR